MLRVLACVTQSHNGGLLALAVILCLMTSAAAFLMLRRSSRHRNDGIGTLWAVAAGFTAGVGVWSTHLVGMTAYDPGLRTTFSLGPLLTSFSVSVAIQTFVFWQAGMHARQSSAIHSWRWTPVALGAFSGLGIALMHYIGMTGLIAAAFYIWDRPMAVIAILLGCTLAGFAMYIFYRPKAGPRAYLYAGLCFVAAICALHFIGMSALTLIPAPAKGQITEGVTREMLGLMVGFVATLVLIAGLATAFADAFLDTRREEENLRLRETVTEQTAKLRELVQQEAALKEQAEAANIAKSLFLATMSHELRTPLNAIIGYSEIIQEDADADGLPTYSTDAKNIVAAGQRLLGLVNQVLDMSMMDAGRMELNAGEFDVLAVSRQTLDTFKAEADASANRLHFNPQGALGIASNDAARVKQCLSHLISNAIKFTTSGDVTLDVRRENKNGAEEIVFAVTDTGPGLNPEQQAKLFSAFQQVDNSATRAHDGAGLGLAISQRLARLMGGDITVNSVLGFGSTFTLRINAGLSAATPQAKAA